MIPGRWQRTEGQASWAKPGHIPGSINIPAQVLADEKNVALIKYPDDLREIFVSQGVTPDKTVICSCGTGRTATLMFLVLKWYLSYPRVVMYEGGFTEWISYPENPVEMGTKGTFSFSRTRTNPVPCTTA